MEVHIFLLPVSGRTTTPTIMKKEKKIVSESIDNPAKDFDSLQHETPG
jgi:hypothetical protein